MSKQCAGQCVTQASTHTRHIDRHLLHQICTTDWDTDSRDGPGTTGLCDFKACVRLSASEGQGNKKEKKKRGGGVGVG